MEGKDYFVAILPYQLSVFHNLLSRKRVEQQITADDFDKMSFDMEYEALFVGENENAYYKLDDIQKCRTIPKAFYPPTSIEYIENKNSKKPKNLSNIPKQAGEYRLIGLDVALMGSSKALKNDTTAFTLMRLIPNGGEFRRDVVYLESLAGGHTETQAIRLKQLFYDFETDYVIMDTNGNGMKTCPPFWKLKGNQIAELSKDAEMPT